MIVLELCVICCTSCGYIVFFFFSSRRRHTRFDCDWSSDVCSSDLVAGIAWIGHLYFFNFVNSQVAKTYDADSKKKVIPELMPRALYWFRWGAAYTWVTGFLLAGMVYYQGSNLLPADSSTSLGAGIGLSLLLIVAVFFVYDALWKAMAKNEQGGVIVSFILVAVLL